MAPSYATSGDLESFLPAAVEVDGDEAEVTRILARATEVIDEVVRSPFTVDDDGAPVDEPVAEALRAATCAQVEFWLEVDEAHDVAGMGGRQVSLAGLSMAALPPTLAPRAQRVLRTAGLLGQPAVAGRYPALAGWGCTP